MREVYKSRHGPSNLDQANMLLASLVATVLTATHAVLTVNAQIVVAHFMAQNAFSYSQSDWTNDINTAKSIGIDGFGE
jgi:glucan endo-1,3-alpha-glucosidase